MRLTPRVAVTGIFLLNGTAFGGWYGRIPAIAGDLGLSDAALGLALFGAPLGLLASQLAVGAVIARSGSRPVLALNPLLLLAVVLPALAGDGIGLFSVLLVVGAANGTIDIAMNAQGLAIERTSERRFFSTLHAAFSIGAALGAGVAAIAAGLEVAPLPHLAVASLACAAIALVLDRGLVADRPASPGPLIARPRGGLVAVAAVALCALLAEGSVLDWSAILLEGEAGASAGVAPLGLVAFSITMAAGRLAGDGIAERLGSAAAASGGALLAALAISVALFGAGTELPGLAIAAFAAAGAGLSVVFPLMLRAAGRSRDGAAALAAVSTFGYAGFLAGPPVIGLLSGAAGLVAALGVVALALLVAAALARPGGPAAGV